MTEYVITKDNTQECVRHIREAIKQALDQSGNIVENDAAKNCPVDTGRLRNSLTHVVSDNKVEIGSDVEYALYVETGHKSKSNFLRNALTYNTEKIEEAFKSAF